MESRVLDSPFDGWKDWGLPQVRLHLLKNIMEKKYLDFDVEERKVINGKFRNEFYPEYSTYHIGVTLTDLNPTVFKSEDGAYDVMIGYKRQFEDRLKKCSYCEGKGSIRPFSFDVPCPRCKGTQEEPKFQKKTIEMTSTQKTH